MHHEYLLSRLAQISANNLFRLITYASAFIIGTFYYNYSLANTIYSKINLGYIKLNNYNDYTPGSKELLDNTKPSSSPLLALGLGYVINNKLSAELSIEYSNHSFRARNQNTDIPIETYVGEDSDGYPFTAQLYPFSSSKLKIKTAALLINLNYTLPRYNNITPYLTVGLGIARHWSSNYKMYTTLFNNHPSIDVLVPEKPSTSFAYNAGVGMLAPFNERSFLDIGLKFFDYGKSATESKLYINNTFKTKAGVVGTKLKGAIVSCGITYLF